MAAVFRAAFGNVTLRRVGIAYSLFGAAEYGIWLALLVYAYGHGGATAGMLMVLVQLIPSSLLAPFIGALADRLRPASVLRVSYGLQAASIAAVAVAVTAGVPDIVVFVLAPLTSLSLTATRPAQAALLPAIVRTPEELTAANVMTGWTEGAASLVGPTVVGALLAWRGAGLAVAATAAMTAVSALLVATLVGPAAATTVGRRIKPGWGGTPAASSRRSVSESAPTSPSRAGMRRPGSCSSCTRSITPSSVLSICCVWSLRSASCTSGRAEPGT